MNHIEQAYEQGLRVRGKEWDKKEWVKKYSDTESIDESGDILSSFWSFDDYPEKWEIWHEDKPEQPVIQTTIVQVEDLLHNLKQLLETLKKLQTHA